MLKIESKTNTRRLRTIKTRPRMLKTKLQMREL